MHSFIAEVKALLYLFQCLNSVGLATGSTLTSNKPAVVEKDLLYLFVRRYLSDVGEFSIRVSF